MAEARALKFCTKGDYIKSCQRDDKPTFLGLPSILLSTDARCLIIILGGQYNMVDFCHVVLC